MESKIGFNDLNISLKIIMVLCLGVVGLYSLTWIIGFMISIK